MIALFDKLGTGYVLRDDCLVFTGPFRASIKAYYSTKELSMPEKLRMSSGVPQLDRLLGGLFIGDNVVWLDDSGSLASVFCLNFLRASRASNKPLVYVSFDRSPRNLLDRLGPLASDENLIILDCFTHGKGAGSAIFLRFYEDQAQDAPCRVVKIDEPRQTDRVMEGLYAIHSSLQGDVRFVFESITGMQELWGGEEQLLSFYSHSCPRLYELNTIAYWIMEKKAHSPRLRAQIGQIAQVVIDLAIKRGTTSLTILKAERRDLEVIQEPQNYWTRDLSISFEDDRHPSGLIELGSRLRSLRNRSGLSQTEVAKRIGVTPSTISQIESNLIYPSLPALLKLAEVLSVDVSVLLQGDGKNRQRFVFPANEALPVRLTALSEGTVQARLLTAADFGHKAEPYLIEIAPGQTLNAHFFAHKGEELGYLISGTLQLKIANTAQDLHEGDLVYVVSETPDQWRNPGPGVARLLWITMK
jgi:transcriptional regulator with XRE-family HTH domain/KaiC/GvpD/RAD55 family RecA-like ATPase